MYTFLSTAGMMLLGCLVATPYFLVHYATTTKVVESVVSDGTIGTELISLAKNALIKKSDYWSNSNNIIPISNENL